MLCKTQGGPFLSFVPSRLVLFSGHTWPYTQNMYLPIPVRSSALCSKLPICFLALLLFAAPAPGQNKVVGLPIPDGDLQLEEPFPDLSFTRPVDFQTPGDGSDRIFVVEQAGVIKVFDNSSGAASTETWARYKEPGPATRATEEGLLGLAFHPNFASNGYFFVNYTASSPRRTVVGSLQCRSERFRSRPVKRDRHSRSSPAVQQS